MDDISFVAYLGFNVLFCCVEGVLLARTGSWRRRPRKDWTYLAVTVPLKMTLLLPIVEQLALQREIAPWCYGVGGMLFLAATVVRAKGHLDLGAGFTPYIEKLEGRDLVDRGIYRHLRHPMYLAILCLALACPVFLGAYYSLGASFLTVAGLLIRIRGEERYLTVHMPGYAEYLKGTWAVLPGIY